MDHTALCDALDEEAGRYAATLEAVALDDWKTPVPSCPGWDVAELVRHLATVHRWAAAMVRARSSERLDRRSLDIEVPSDTGGYAAWFAGGAAALVRALRDADPDAAMWSWGADQHVRFWSRRQLHETAVHHADARLALGLQPELTVDAAAAADGVDELLDNLAHAAYFAPGVAELRGDGQTIHLHATEGGEWLITLTPGGYEYEHRHAKATVAVRAPAADLLLLSYNRRSLAGGRGGERFEVFGDRTVLEHWLAHAAL